MLTRKALILAVEDDPIIRMGALYLVVAAGFDAVGAHSADEAIRVLEARSDIHLVFADVGMPGTMDGIGLSHYIRDRWPPLKLIVASGNTIASERDLPAGARFFPKPYNESALIDAFVGRVSDANGGRPPSGGSSQTV
jgi:two-component system, response regulator PdtaR